MGIAENIAVGYRLLSEYSSKKLLGTEINAAFNFEIKIKNSEKSKIEIEIVDQVPVSSESSVRVETKDLPALSEQDPTTGAVLWSEEIASGSEKTINLKYSVTYPRKKGYSIQKSQNNYINRNVRFL